MKTNRLARQTFLALIIGFIVLFASIFFIVNAYWRLTRSELTPKRITSNIVRIIRLAELLPPDQVRTMLRYIKHPGIRIHFSKRVPKRSKIINKLSSKSVYRDVEKNPDAVHLVFARSSHLFIHFRTRIERPLRLKMQFIAALIVWLSALIAFCYFIVRQLSHPLSLFIQGANRFSQDINAPPIPETGPASTRSAFHAFNKMQSNLKQLLQDRTQMLAAISHDLRTPITRLKLRLENFEASPASKKMENDLEQMESMINSILSFARDEYQHEPVSKVDLNALLQSICDDMQDANRAVKFEESGDRPIVLGRPMALRRAIENIINNGVEYGKAVDVRSISGAEYTTLILEDKGPGIPESEMEKVFLPFYRLDRSRSSGKAGSGLGLATARDIIRSHGGDIQLENGELEGLKVIIKLPV